MGLRGDATWLTSSLIRSFTLRLLDVGLDRLLEARSGLFSMSSPLLISFDGSISPGIAKR